MPRLNLSPEGRKKHEAFLVNMFSKDVYVVTEWKDDSVWKTKKVGTIVAHMGDHPFRPNVAVRTTPT